MNSRHSTTSMLSAVTFSLLWMVGVATSTSIHTISHNNNNNTSHDQNMRGAASKISGLDHDESTILKELKEIVVFMSHKIDDSDQRLRSLEGKVRAQELTIKNLEKQVNSASSLHRYLQEADTDCLPTFVNSSFGPRCDFRYVTRFQDRTIFNDGVVFNENVEFDSDANCMPTYNSTTRMCMLNNNFTFDEGDIIFDFNVRFDEDVRFNDDVTFRDPVFLQNDVTFDDEGEVTFRKDTKFHENVLIRNDDHEIEFKIEDKVKAKFNQDRTMEVNTFTKFSKDVEMDEDLNVDGKLKVESLAELDDLELYGYLWVDKETYLEGELTVEHHASLKDGLTIDKGGLDVSRDGAKISGTTEVDGTFRLDGNGFAEKNFTVDGKLTSKSLLVDSTPTDSRKLQTMIDGYIVPGSGSSPPQTPSVAFEVIGDATIDGLLKAFQIRSGDINGGNEPDINDIMQQLRDEFRDVNLALGDVTVRNGLDNREKVLTETRMLEMLKDSVLEVVSIIADSATIGGDDFPDEESARTEMTGERVVDLLRGKDLDLNSVSTNLLDAIEATIDGEEYTRSASSGFDMKGFFDDLLDELMVHEGEVTIPNLVSINLDIINAVETDNDGEIIEIPGRIVVDGEEVPTAGDIQRLEREIANLESPDSGSGDCSCSSEFVEDVVDSRYINGKLSELGFSPGSGEGTCSCTVEDIEDVVTSTYITDMGFIDEAPECQCSSSRIRDVVDWDYIDSLGFDFGSGSSFDYISDSSENNSGSSDVDGSSEDTSEDGGLYYIGSDDS